jgi:polysaccharide chain length determinant protein (PEP-CTERM system associated)
MLGQRQLTFDEAMAMVRRRIWWIIIPTVLTPVIALLVTFKLKPRYTSQALVLVEQQKVPDAFVTSVVTEQLNVRLLTMQEQILSRTRLQPIIERFSLFRDQIGKASMEELVEQTRKAITVTPIRGDPSGRGLPGFHIAFTAENPRLAQQVCTEIMSMFMEENLKIREQRAQGTTDFLSKQLDEAKRKLDEQDAKLAEFKSKHLGQLPTDDQRNLQMLGALGQQLDAVNQALSSAHQQKTMLESQLAQAQANWLSAQSSTSNPTDLQRQIEALQAQLTSLQGRYTEGHPDVVKTRSQLQRLTKKLEEARTAPVPEKPADLALEPPQIAQLRVSIRLVQDSIRQRTLEQDALKREISTYQQRIQMTPRVEEGHKALTRDYETALLFYQDLLRKKTQSEMATDLERRQQGEQFRVMDPPNLPERPTFPKRPLFAGGGLVVGLGVGLGLTLLLEFRDRALRTEKDVEFYLGLPTLALMPEVSLRRLTSSANGNDRWRFWRRKRQDAARQAMGA